MRKKLIMVISFFVLWVTLHSVLLIIYGLTNSYTRADCILILGNTVNQDGSLSGRLKSRLDKGFELYQQKVAPIIVVSGGLGKEGYVEGVEMATYLLSKGVPKEAIIIEDKAKTTFETMTNFIPIALTNNLKSVIIVSQYYHLFRSVAMLNYYRFTTIEYAHAPYMEARDVYSIPREFLAFYSFKLKTLYLHFFKN